MAFCNSCGAAMDAGAKFCPKCGAASAAPVSAPSGTPGAATATPAQGGGSGALKIILIVVAILVGLAVLGAGAVGFVAWHIAHRTHIMQRNGVVKVETPFGTVESTEDPNQAARNVDVDVYPGASVVKGTSANMTFGGMHTAAVEFESADPASTVADFYKSKFPNANMMSANGDRYTIVAGDKNNMTTITIEPKGGKTRIHIAKVSGKIGGSTTSTPN